MNMDVNISTTTISPIDHDPAGDVAMDNLYPALLQCFGIIICGYVAGRMNIISQNEAKGLNTFVGIFSLPSLIFLSLVELDLSSVNWNFLLAVLVAKSIVFIVVIVVTILVSRPVSPGRAGLFSIFCTQSNDFAVGYPIVVALYKSSHPDYASYLYLMAPISLVILNPIGFILMEIDRQNSNEMHVEMDMRKKRLPMIGAVAKKIVTNPIVFMTALGMIANVIFNHHLPTWLAGILQVLGSAFSATALFLLGLVMVGKVHKLQGAALVVPGILIAVKLLALPLVTREIVSLFHPGTNSSEDLDFSTFGFLYGTFPAAPGVFVFSMQYALDTELIASAMVACTFLSAPLMCISAKMVTINILKPLDYLQELDSFALDISVAGIIVCVWLLVVFLLSGKYKRIPHRVTFCLVVSQLFSCVGIVLWSRLDRSTAVSMYVQFAFYTVGVYSARLWTAFLAISLLFLQCRSLCFVLKLQPVFIVLGWGIPLILVTVLMLVVDPDSVGKEKINPNFQYGDAQAAVSACLLVLCFLVTVGSLIIHQRYRRRYARYVLLVQDMSGASDAETSNAESDLCSGDTCITQGCKTELIDIEDIGSPSRSAKSGSRQQAPSVNSDVCPTSFGCDFSTRDRCQSLVTKYHNLEECDGEEEKDQQILRHIVLLILLVCSMFVGIALSIWTLVLDDLSGIYVELSFLDASLNFGQSLIVFAVFGLDVKVIVLPILKRWRKIWYGGAAIVLPDWNDLDFETRHVCEQFITHHMEKCVKDIAKDRRCRLHFYKKVFKGTQLVDWLLGVGLAHERVEAVHYARHLLEGRVIRHVENLHHFHDSSLLYTFVLNSNE